MLASYFFIKGIFVNITITLNERNSCSKNSLGSYTFIYDAPVHHYDDAYSITTCQRSKVLLIKEAIVNLIKGKPFGQSVIN